MEVRVEREAVEGDGGGLCGWRQGVVVRAWHGPEMRALAAEARKGCCAVCDAPLRKRRRDQRICTNVACRSEYQRLYGHDKKPRGFKLRVVRESYPGRDAIEWGSRVGRGSLGGRVRVRAAAVRADHGELVTRCVGARRV